MKVLKFGGTSLGNSQRIQSVARIVVKNENCFVVCSAMAGVTNALEETALAWKNGDTSSAETKLLAIRKGFEQTCYDLFDTHEKASEILEVLNNHFDLTSKLFSNPFTKLGHKTLLALGEIVTSSMFASYLAGKGQNAHLVDALDILQLNDQDEPEPKIFKEKYRILD
jgi:aspartate kinase